MNRCKSKRGFFALRDCGEVASRPCGACGRLTCANHLSQSSGFSRCLDCEARIEAGAPIPGKAAAQQPLAATPVAKIASKKPEDETYDRAWAYRYRHRYYSTAAYAPVYWGSYYDSYYNDYDVRSFDRDVASHTRTESITEQGAGFADS